MIFTAEVLPERARDDGSLARDDDGWMDEKWMDEEMST
jgi:hypothetical protein